MTIAGVMSGSSLDGLDIAIVDLKRNGSWELKDTFAMAYDNEWIERLQQFHTLSASEYVKLKYDYSYLIGGMLKDIFSDQNTPEYISFHGHTLMHSPENGFTEQIGNGAILANITGVPTITEFRNGDIARGGQGTPLAPIVEVSLFKGYDYYLNLGGIANITKVTSKKVVAYDICPCNQVMNHFSQILNQEYDKGGELAKNGTYRLSISKYLDTISYFSQAPPKSLDNNWIRKEFIPHLPNENPQDVMHTYARWMANHISKQVESNDSKMLVSGGGTHNTFFIQLLKEALNKKNCILEIPSKEIIDFKEAILMTVLAQKYLTNESNVLSSVTGSKKDTIGGALHKVL